MNKQFLIVFALAAITLPAVFASAATDPSPTQKNVQAQDSDQIYGSRLMTLEERTEFRAKMQAAKSVAEREQLRNEHHKAMQERAASRGITLPDQPPAGGQGMGPGKGMMGQGGGMGAGKGRSQ